MATPRRNHTATLLPNGKVLIAGGYGNTLPGPLSSAQLYDPGSGTWSTTGSFSTARYGHEAMLLPTGRVRIAGGAGSNGSLASARTYETGSGTWTATGSLLSGRGGLTMDLRDKRNARVDQS